MKISAALIAVFAVALITFITIDPIRADNESTDRAAQSTAVLTDDAYRLTSAADGKVNLVEFLDFECEACRALYPTMERIRAEYEDRITFGIRYFPIPSHTNSALAAQVVESASRQGKFVEMYQRMYETQSQWGESAESQEALFRSYAQDLGLDMTRFDSDLSSRGVRERVERDFEEGRRLGVQGTPTLFLNDVKLAPMPTYEDLKAQIDSALGE
ncbi:DsbA family protein [Rhodococcus sp. NPDC057135]|uniref:DsbA family protein n=1 Tax=Rhodococcus sp. NPDC057135 TaxID=3346028 RepID=UPI00362F2085